MNDKQTPPASGTAAGLSVATGSEVCVDEEIRWFFEDDFGPSCGPRTWKLVERLRNERKQLKDEVIRLRASLNLALPVLDEHATDERSFWGIDDKHGLARDAEKIHELAKAALSPNTPDEPRLRPKND